MKKGSYWVILFFGLVFSISLCLGAPLGSLENFGESYLNSGYASPVDFFNNNADIFSSSAENFVLSAGNQIVDLNVAGSIPGGYIFKRGWLWNSRIGDWIPFEFDNPGISGSYWINGSQSISKNLKINATNNLINGFNFIAVFSCKRYNNEWKCGCESAQDTSCNKWALLAFKVNNANWTVTPSGGSCVIDSECNSAFGERCTSQTCQVFNCVNDSECSGKRCLTGICLECTSDSQCNSTQYCNLTEKKCFNKIISLFAGGKGIFGDPYQIASWSHLNNTRLNLSGYYILTENLSSLSPGYSGIGNNWIPIGSSTAPFIGDFDGNGHVISGLSSTSSAYQHVGFFGYSSGNIQKLGISASFSSNFAPQSRLGILVGYQSGGTISQCFTSGSVYASYGGAGGLVGFKAGGTISDCYSTATAYAYGHIGGLVGEQDGGTISRSYSSGSASGSSHIGGLVGWNRGGDVFNSFSTSAVSGSTYRGGFIGLKGSGTVVGSGWWTGSTTNAIGLPVTPSLDYNAASKSLFYNKSYGLYSGGGWNFNTGGVWKEVENNYPVLSWQN